MSATDKPSVTGSAGSGGSGTSGAERAGADELAKEASRTAEEARKAVSEVADKAAARGRETAESGFEQGRDMASEQLESASSVVGDLASSMEEQGLPFASYAGEVSEQLTSLSTRLSDSSVDEVVDSVRSLARDNPAVFLLGGVAIGLAASRFFRAAGTEMSSGSDDGRQGGSDGRRQGGSSDHGNTSAGSAGSSTGSTAGSQLRHPIINPPVTPVPTTTPTGTTAPTGRLDTGVSS